MKKSSILLLILLGLFIISLVGSDLVLKSQYNKIDKSDPFWNYTKLNKGSFHHLKLIDGNVTRIAFIPSPHASIGILSYWEEEMDGRVKTKIADDTLFLKVEARNESNGTKEWMRDHTLITITCPELRSVQALNSNLDIGKLNQKAIQVWVAGRSRLEVESYNADFDSLYVHQQDSTDVIFEMADEIKSSGTMHLKALYADVQGHSLLDVGHFRIQSLHQSIGDTSGIILSGYTLGQMKK
ncbi:MAG TPA: hypothetical protein VGO21_03510 [Candidatus Paceibacterota bacterium]|nr:hypothetical protein [Candidatus Paceibacterota bacterium]